MEAHTTPQTPAGTSQAPAGRPLVGRRFAAALLAVAAGVFALRTGELALRDAWPESSGASASAVAPPHQLTAHHEPATPGARVTAVRVASNPGGPGFPDGPRLLVAQNAPVPYAGEWLVAPEAWYAPEERRAQESKGPAQDEDPAPARDEALAPTETPAESPDDSMIDGPPEAGLAEEGLSGEAGGRGADGFGAGDNPGRDELPLPAEDPPVESEPLEPLHSPGRSEEPDPAPDGGSDAAPEAAEGEGDWRGRGGDGPDAETLPSPALPDDTITPLPDDAEELPDAPALPAERDGPPVERLPDAPPADAPSPVDSPSFGTPSDGAVPEAPVRDDVRDEPAPGLGPADPGAAGPSAENLAPELPAAPSTPWSPPAPAPVAPSAPHAVGPRETDPVKAAQTAAEALKAHRELFAKNCYPSARECAECHKKTYDEWRISSHAYSHVSPMFHKFEQKLTDLSQGTVGYFCMRCHAPVAVAMGEARHTPIGEMAPVAREGVTCIACHRVNERYAKTNGERRIEPGDIFMPVYGGLDGSGVQTAIADKAKYKVKTSPDEKGAGQPLHVEGRFFDQITRSEFCTACHQVAVHPGIKLEVVWEQYRASPACKLGISCQDCHMGVEPGVASGYEYCSIAEVGGKSVNEFRKHHNHSFYGPGYSVAHPGVYPQSKEGDRWTMDEWLAFDWRAGWGTDDFEEAVEEGQLPDQFPPAWRESDDRYDAREVVEANLKLLLKKRDLRVRVMEHSLKVEGPFFAHHPARGAELKLDYVVTNMNAGHNVLTASLGAQPQLWANVVLIDPLGRRVWESGYTDSAGDLANLHSVDVRHKRIPYDSQLFNLQTIFLIAGATGTDREFPLPVNVSVDQLPFLRPGAVPVSVLNHPPQIRMESRSLAPLGSKRVKYTIPAEALCVPGRYRLSFRMRERAEPIYFVRFCEGTPETERAMNEGIIDLHPYSVEFDVR